MSDSGVINIHGKEYHTVAKRVSDFRASHPGYSISSKILSAADIIQIKATIRDEAGRVIATGLAEEVRGATNINKTSALENAETSAVGRALAFFGLGGTEIASADEVSNAELQQQILDAVERLKAHNVAVRDNIESIVAIKHHLLNDEYGAAYEIMAVDIPDDDKLALWISTTQGGIWTTKERAQMKCDQWTEARREYHKEDDQ